MLDLNIEKIVPVEEAKENFDQIVDEVASTDELYVLTKAGQPTAIVVGVHHLETLTGINHQEFMGEIAGYAKPADTSSVMPNERVSNDSNPSQAPVEEVKIDLPPVPPIDTTSVPAPDAPVLADQPVDNPAQVTDAPLTTPDWASTPETQEEPLSAATTDTEPATTINPALSSGADMFASTAATVSTPASAPAPLDDMSSPAASPINQTPPSPVEPVSAASPLDQTPSDNSFAMPNPVTDEEQVEPILPPMPTPQATTPPAQPASPVPPANPPANPFGQNGI